MIYDCLVCYRISKIGAAGDWQLQTEKRTLSSDFLIEVRTEISKMAQPYTREVITPSDVTLTFVGFELIE